MAETSATETGSGGSGGDGGGAGGAGGNVTMSFGAGGDMNVFVRTVNGCGWQNLNSSTFH